MDAEINFYLLEIKDRIEKNFTSSDWKELGFILGRSYVIDGHPRLLRSLSFGDDDYSGNILDVLRDFYNEDASSPSKVAAYLDRKYPEESTYVSSIHSVRRISFAPNVFQVPDCMVEFDLVSVMMPFGKEYEDVLITIRKSCEEAGLRCKRADDIWEHSTFIQDIFNLIFRSFIVIVDFSGKNPNVMYETGIAHTLGKHVIPIASSIDDVPSDMRHHRAKPYLKNKEGLAALKIDLVRRLRQLTTGSPDMPKQNGKSFVSEEVQNDGDIPF
jgi:hypothetical protein